jgi:suppressor of fused protein SUFU
MSTAEKFSGFIDHIQRYLGAIRDGEPPTVDGGNRGYALFFLVNAKGDLVSVVTNGLRFQRVRAVMPQELVVTVHARHERGAHFLAKITADQVVRTGVGLVYDQVVMADNPVVPGTQIHGVIASTHPYVDADMEDMPGADGETELQLLTLIPITGAEGQLARTQGADALYDRWEAAATDLLDLARPSAV